MFKEKKKRKPLTKSHKEAISNALKGKVKTDVHLEKIRVANTGKHPTAITLIKLRESHLGQKSWNKGRVGIYSVETLKKMSEVKIGKKSPHTPEQNIKIGEAQRGARGNNWKGGITPVVRRERSSANHKNWSSGVFKRDDFTCQKTGVRGGILHAHHILGFAEHPELRFAIDNGITLSEVAHKAFHKKYGRKGNTREQLVEFLQEKDSTMLK